jgi:hypothetical protein
VSSGLSHGRAEDDLVVVGIDVGELAHAVVGVVRSRRITIPAALSSP